VIPLTCLTLSQHKYDRVKHVNGITTRLLMEQTHTYDRVKHVNGITTRLLMEQTHKYDRVKHCDPINMFNSVTFVCMF
jgi:hypothetical protein